MCVLIATLLLCPYTCLSHAAAGSWASATAGRQTCDCCCPGPASEAGKDRPCEPGSSPVNGTCLCHGAVMDRHVAPPTLDQAFVAILPLDAMLLVRESFATQRDFPAEHVACHFAAAISGRDVRALMASLLL